MNKVSKVFNILFIALLYLIVITKCAYLFQLLPFKFAIIGSIFLVLIGVFIFWKKTVLDKIEKVVNKYLIELSYRKMLLILICLSLGLKLFVIFIFQIASIASHPDVQVYVTTAKELAETGIVQKYADYCYTYSHMFWYAVFLSPIVGVLGDSQLVLSVYTAVISTITIILIVDTITYQFSKMKAFTLGFVLCLLPSQILVSQYITHEHALLFFLAIAMWLYFRILPEQKLRIGKNIISVLFILNLFAAYMMNTAGLVMILAFIILILVNALKDFSLNNLIYAISKCVLLFIFVIIGTVVCMSFQTARSELSDDYIKGDKILWTLYVGSNVDTSAHWSFEDTESFSAYPENSSNEEIQQFRKDVLLRRYKELFETPEDLFYLLKEKLITIWSCFTYPIMYTSETIPNQFMQAFYSRFLSHILVLVEFGASVLAVFWCLAFSMQKLKTKKYSDFLLIVKLYLMGSTAMLLLTECNNKYTLAMQPFFWLVCIMENSRRAV